MKLTKIIFFVILFKICAISSFASAVITPDTIHKDIPVQGQKSLMIGINPLISFVGNLFNSYNNGINLNSGSLLYRKYVDNNLSKRYRLNVFIKSERTVFFYSENFPSNLYNGYERESRIHLSFAYGKEKRYNLNRFSAYTGWEFISGLNHNSKIWFYDYNEGDKVDPQFSVFYVKRDKSRGITNSLNLGIAGIFGVDYHFSKMFNVNLEFSLPFIFTAAIEGIDKREEITITTEGKLVLSESNDSQKPRFVWAAEFNTSQIVQFRGGVVF